MGVNYHCNMCYFVIKCSSFNVCLNQWVICQDRRSRRLQLPVDFIPLEILRLSHIKCVNFLPVFTYSLNNSLWQWLTTPQWSLNVGFCFCSALYLLSINRRRRRQNWKNPVIGHLLLTEICHLEGNHFREASHSDSHNTDVRSLQAKKRQFLVPTFPLVKLRIITLSFQRDSLSPVGALWCRVLNLCQGTGGGAPHPWQRCSKYKQWATRGNIARRLPEVWKSNAPYVRNMFSSYKTEVVTGIYMRNLKKK